MERDKTSSRICISEDSGACLKLGGASKRTRMFSKTILVFTVLCFVLSFWTWKWYLRPVWNDDWEMKEGFLTNADGVDSTKNKHAFDGVRLKDLEDSLIPGGESDPDGKRRLMFIGDIHGCSRELKALLEKVAFDKEKDHLI